LGRSGRLREEEEEDLKREEGRGKKVYCRGREEQRWISDSHGSSSELAGKGK
jgi:hypothetical protein